MRQERGGAGETLHETKPENHPQLMLGVCSVGRELTSSNVFMSWLLPVNGGGGHKWQLGMLFVPEGLACFCGFLSAVQPEGRGGEGSVVARPV